MTASWQTIPDWDGTSKNVHLLIRSTVTLPAGAWEVRLSAFDHYALWVDGVYMGQGPVPAYPEASCCDCYRLTGGRTVTLAIHLYAQGLVNRVFCGGEGRLGLYLAVCQGQRRVKLDAARFFRCLAYSGGTVGYETAYLENFDSRLWPEGWEQPDYRDSHWQRLIPLDAPEPKPRPIPPLWEGTIEPRKITEVPGGLLLDFGREVAGNLTVRAKGPEGEPVTLRFAEELDERGRARFDMRCGCRYEQVWTLGAEESVYHPWDYLAMRYAEILYGAPVTISSFQMNVRHYPLPEEACTLRCPQDELEDIFAICKNAVRWCTQDTYLDCATREKGQYLGDAIITAHSQVWLTGSTELLRKCIRDFMASQSRFPGILAVAPCTLEQRIADFSLLFPMLPLIDYGFTGDRAFLSQCYPAVKTMVDYFGAFRRPDGLLENVGELWNLVDWPEGARDGYDFPLTRPVVGNGCHNVVNALWYGANRMKERMEKILEIPSTQASEAIGASFCRCFFREPQQLFADSERTDHCSIHANLYPAFFGLTPNADAYEQLLLTPGRHCGVMPMYFALAGLARLGRREAVYRLITRTDDYGWRNMLRQGATACMEAWGKEQKWNTSLCHPWASGPIALIIEELAGIHPDPTAEDGIRLDPALPECLTDFSLTVPWRGGRIHVEKTPGGRPVIERSTTCSTLN